MPSKAKTTFTCTTCGYNSPKWLGKCPDCEAWNSFQEAVITKSKSTVRPAISAKPISLAQVKHESTRLNTSFNDLNLVLGGGLKTGSLLLMSGEPGIGKSTLTLQICQQLSAQLNSVLYISGEESVEQISDRAARIDFRAGDNFTLINETSLEQILAHLDRNEPELVIIDSIQVLASEELPSMAGSINQVRYCTEALMEFAKKRDITIIIVGHINKDGNLAGPKILEHLVDTVLFLEGDRYQNLRILRSLKNRFGSTNEISILEMTGEGFTEIENPSESFLEGRKKNAIGSSITVTTEGNRPLILEVQALTSPTVFGYPKRTASGYDINRLQLLAAVIQKFLKINLSNQDIYINVIGGFKLRENANDLAIIAAIISSYRKTPLPPETVFLSEIGLSGELRSINMLEKRIKEAEKLGFKQIITSKLKQPLKSKAEIIQISELEELQKIIT